MLTASCDIGDEPETMRAEDLLSNPVVSFPEEGDSAPPLGRIAGVLPLTADSVIFINKSSPFLHLYSVGDGFLGAAGPKGGGPGELRGVRSAAVRGAALWLLDGDLKMWSWSPLHELARLEPPFATIKVFTGCGSELLGIFQGEERGDTGGIAYGLQRFRDSSWQTMSSLARPSNPLVVSSPGNQPLPLGDTIAFLGAASNRLDFFSCAGRLLSTTPLPRPDEWPGERGRGGNFPRGLVPLDGYLAVFYSWQRRADTTLVALWDRERGGLNGGGEVRMIRGDISFFAADDSLVWAVTYDPAPRISAVRIRRMAELLLRRR